MADATANVMTVEPEKSLAQIAYETFLEGLAKTEEGADEVKHAPPWGHLPEYVCTVIADSVGAALRSFAPALVVDVAPEDQAFAQVGYQAYIASTGGLNYQGLPCPEWTKLPPAIQAAWAAAAVSIRCEHEHRVATDYDLAVSKDELAELVAALDSLQRADIHTADVLLPLRSRLRAVLFPPEPEPQALPAQLIEQAGESPTLELDPSNEGEKPEPASEPSNVTDPYAGYHAAVAAERAASETDPKGEAVAADALDPAKAGTDSSAPEQTDPATGAESLAQPSASGGNVVASEPVELPAVSEAPPAPGLPGLDPLPRATPDDAPAPAIEESK
jgi:hypothetical protein